MSREFLKEVKFGTAQKKQFQDIYLKRASAFKIVKKWLVGFQSYNFSLLDQFCFRATVINNDIVRHFVIIQEMGL